MNPDKTISEIKDKADLLEQADKLKFDAPWQARAFSVVLTMYERDLFQWNEFQARLIEEVQSDGSAAEDLESVYYEQWITAFEKLLLDKGICEPDELQHRVAEFASGQRDASEFVSGADHSHSH